MRKGNYGIYNSKNNRYQAQAACWFDTDYNMNIYRGCSHGCIYCDSRSECYRVDNFDTVKAKENSTEIIAKNLSSKREKGVVATGAMSDPYNPKEEKYLLTRSALEQVSKHSFGIAIATKSDLICRDIDVLKEISGKMPTIIKVTVTTSSNETAKIIEPFASSPEKRFSAIENLSSHGIFTGVLLMPVLPFICDNPNSITSLVKNAAQSGARFIYPAFGVTMRDIQRDWYYKKLDEHFPGLRAKHEQMFGSRYNCSARNAKHLRQLFTQECLKYKILYKMPDIISAYKAGYGTKQLSFFT